MTFTEAAVLILRWAGRPLHYKKIAELSIEHNLLSHVGRTPELTMSSRLATAVRRDGDETLVVKVKPGIFGLREFTEEALRLADSETLQLPKEPPLIPPATISTPSSPHSAAVRIAEDYMQTDDYLGSAIDASLLTTDSSIDPKVAAELGPVASTPAAAETVAGLFRVEEDDDEPILARLDAEQQESTYTDEGGVRRRRRRRRRRGNGAGASEGGGVDAGGMEESQGEDDEDQGSLETDEVESERGETHRSESYRGGSERGRRSSGRDPVTGSNAGDMVGGSAAGDLLGKELSDAVETVLGQQATRQAVPLVRLAELLIRRGRLSGSPAALVPTLTAAIRGDMSRRTQSQRRQRLRMSQGRVAAVDWYLSAETIRSEKQLYQLADDHRAVVRRAFLARLNTLPSAGLMELLAAWLNAEGVVSLRAVRRPGIRSGEFHLAGVLRRYGASVGGGEETPLAIVVGREAALGRENVIDVRGSLHHYGQASMAWIVTTGQVRSGAREEAAVAGVAPCALFDGMDLAAALEKAGIGLLRHSVPVISIDLDLLDGLGGSLEDVPRLREERSGSRDRQGSDRQGSDRVSRERPSRGRDRDLNRGGRRQPQAADRTAEAVERSDQDTAELQREQLADLEDFTSESTPLPRLSTAVERSDAEAGLDDGTAVAAPRAIRDEDVAGEAPAPEASAADDLEAEGFVS